MIEAFVKNLKADKNDFTITHTKYGTKKYLSFICRHINDIKLIYLYDYYGKDSQAYISGKYELAAIQNGNTIYVLDIYNIDNCTGKVEDGYRFTHLPELMGEYNQRAIAAFDDVWNSSEPLLNDNDSYCREIATKYIIEGITMDYHNFASYIIPSYTEQDAINFITGTIDFEKNLEAYLESAREKICGYKGLAETIEKLMQSGDIIKECYVRMAQGIRSLKDAKTLNVTFELNGRTDTGKIEPHVILNKLKKSTDYFSDYNFYTSTQGRKVISELRASDSLWGDKPRLTVEHISKITYGKKVIYQR